MDLETVEKNPVKFGVVKAMRDDVGWDAIPDGCGDRDLKVVFLVADLKISVGSDHNRQHTPDRRIESAHGKGQTLG